MEPPTLNLKGLILDFGVETAKIIGKAKCSGLKCLTLDFGVEPAYNPWQSKAFGRYIPMEHSTLNLIGLTFDFGVESAKILGKAKCSGLKGLTLDFGVELA